MTAATLSAWSVSRYGGPDRLVPVTRPMPTPGPTEVLIRIRASAATRADGMMRAGTPRFARLFLGLGRPRKDLVGTCMSGEIVAVGDKVTRFAVGDDVFGGTGMNFGANASHVCVDEAGVLVRKPDDLPHEDAAVMFDGPVTSMNFLQNVGEVQPGDRVLILGGSGGLGSAAVQIAVAMGARVTATCSTRNMAFVEDLGAHRVIDYTTEDALAARGAYDVIYDTIGVSSFRRARRSLAPRGRYICPVLTLPLLFAMLRTSLVGGRKARFQPTGLQKPEVLRDMLDRLLKLYAAGQFAPAQDRVYPLSDIVEAHRYVDAGHKRGNVVLVS